MDKREQLRSMLNNLINDKPEEATLDLHNYLTGKMKEVAGTVPAVDDETPPAGNEDDTPSGDEA